MSSLGADISAYPVLRIDELTLFDAEFLRKAATDVTELINILNAEKSDQRAMVLYLMKQNDAIQLELTKRVAQDRIERLLRGDVPSTSDSSFTLFSSTSGSGLLRPPPSPAHQVSEVAAAESYPSRASSILQVPTPSELKAREILSASLLQQNSGFDDNGINSSSLSSFRNNNLHSSRSAPIFSSTNKAPFSVISASSSAPSKKSLDVLNNSFGVAFVVGATERKRRFLPKPKAAIDTEAIKDKGRNERFLFIIPILLIFYLFLNSELQA